MVTQPNSLLFLAGVADVNGGTLQAIGIFDYNASNMIRRTPQLPTMQIHLQKQFVKEISKHSLRNEEWG